jgi:hypothetical protein
MTRIASLSILFAALIEFAIERARFDLWIVIVAIVPLLWSLGGERYALVWTHRSMTTMSLRPGDSFVMLHGLSSTRSSRSASFRWMRRRFHQSSRRTPTLYSRRQVFM